MKDRVIISSATCLIGGSERSVASSNGGPQMERRQLVGVSQRFTTHDLLDSMRVKIFQIIS